MQTLYDGHTKFETQMIVDADVINNEIYKISHFISRTVLKLMSINLKRCDDLKLASCHEK